MNDEAPLTPSDRIRRIRELARDIAEGAIEKKWTSRLRVIRPDDEARFYDDGLNEGLRDKWGDEHNYYSAHLLAAFGYLARSPLRPEIIEGQEVAYFEITSRAFELLEKPAKPPSVFISYRRDHLSSALGLYIEARLKLVGVPNPFIDKNINAGEQFHALLEDIIRQSEYFVTLIAPRTLDSEWVRKEIDWALHYRAKIMSVLHGEFADHTESGYEKEYLAKLQPYHYIEIKGHSAEDYETGVNKLLNSMDYPTY